MQEISTFLESAPWFFAFAIPAVLMTGLSKGGFGGGIAMLGTPMLALTMSPVKAAAIMLPVMILMDLFGLYNYRMHVKWSIIKTMVPAAILGIIIGGFTASYVSDNFIRILVGIIAIIFALNLWFRDYMKFDKQPENLFKGVFWGTISGFTSFITHAGGPPYQAYTLGLKMEKMLYAGTGVMAFAMINAVKVIPYFLLGQFSSENLIISFTLAPVAIIGVLIGVWGVKHVSQELFYHITYAAMIVVGSKLLWDGREAITSLF